MSVCMEIVVHKTIAFPHTSECLRSGQSLRVVSYGDSISEVGRTPNWHGGATCAAGNWARLFCDQLAAVYPRSTIEFIPFGIGGQNSYEGLGRLDTLAPLKPDLVIVAFGANDCGWHHLTAEQTHLALKNLVDGVRIRYGADVALAGTGGDNPLKPDMAHGQGAGSHLTQLPTLCFTLSAAEPWNLDQPLP